MGSQGLHNMDLHSDPFVPEKFSFFILNLEGSNFIIDKKSDARIVYRKRNIYDSKLGLITEPRVIITEDKKRVTFFVRKNLLETLPQGRNQPS
jgi:hypothetical protein